jgi:hypothetical protein
MAALNPAIRDTGPAGRFRKCLMVVLCGEGLGHEASC